MQKFVLFLADGHELLIDEKARQQLLDAQGLRAWVEIEVNKHGEGQAPEWFIIFMCSVVMISNAV